MLGHKSDGVKRKREVKRGSGAGETGEKGRRMESVGRRKEEGNPGCRAQEQSRCHVLLKAIQNAGI